MTSIKNILAATEDLLENLPSNWLELTTHRLDIYPEEAAKTEFLTALKTLLAEGKTHTEALQQLPTAYDYIRLGHQLSSLLEWVLAEINQVPEDQVITFASKTMPVLALLRMNAINQKFTEIYCLDDDSQALNGEPIIDEARLKAIYGYQFRITQVSSVDDVPTDKEIDEFSMIRRLFDIYHIWIYRWL